MSPDAVVKTALPSTLEQRRSPEAVWTLRSPLTAPTVMSPLAERARRLAATSSAATSPLDVTKSAAPIGPVTSTSADPATTVTSLPSGTSTLTVTALRRMKRLPIAPLGTFTTTVWRPPAERHSTIVRSTRSSSAPGVLPSSRTTVLSVCAAVTATRPTSFCTCRRTVPGVSKLFSMADAPFRFQVVP